MANNICLDPGEELVAIVDGANRVVGKASRCEMRRLALPHRASYILVFNSQNELCIHKRTETKDIYPGFYDIAVGGVVLSGESYEKGAERELFEELGIRGVPLAMHFDFWYEGQGVKVWGRVFSCIWDGEIFPQAEEIVHVEFQPISSILKLAESLPFTPDGLVALRKYLEGSA